MTARSLARSRATSRFQAACPASGLCRETRCASSPSPQRMNSSNGSRGVRSTKKPDGVACSDDTGLHGERRHPTAGDQETAIPSRFYSVERC